MSDPETTPDMPAAEPVGEPDPPSAVPIGSLPTEATETAVAAADAHPARRARTMLAEPSLDSEAGETAAPAVAPLPSARPRRRKPAAASADGVEEQLGGEVSEAAALEERLRRLENALASLADTRQLEERLAERLAARETPQRPAHPSGAKPVAAPVATLVVPTASAAPAAEPPAAGQRRKAFAHGWRLFVDALTELRTMVRMFVDPRYHLTWLGRVGPLGLLLLILFSHWVFFPLTLLPGARYLDKIIDLLLAYALFKVLQREVVHYRESVPDAPGTKPPSPAG